MRPFRLLTFTCVCAFLSFSALQSFAKDPLGYEDKPVHLRQHPDFTPPDIIKGSFIVRPVLETKSWYDSNVFLDSKNEVGDFVFNVHPSLELQSNFSRHALNFKLDTDYTKYTDETDQNTLDASFIVEGKYDINDNAQLGGAVFISRNHEDRNDLTIPSSPQEPTETTQQSAALSFDYAPARFKLSLFGSYSINKFENGISRNTGARLIEEERNVDITSAGTRLAYQYNDNVTPYIVTKASDYRFHHNRFSSVTNGFDGSNQDKMIFSLTPGFSFDYKGLVYGHLHAGIGYERNEDVATDNKKTYLVDAELIWNPTKLTTIQSQLNRSFDTDSDTSAGTVETTAKIHVYHELKRNFIIGAGVDTKFRDFDNNARLDKIYRLKIDGEYRINDHYALTGGYILNRRLSKATSFDYNQDLFYLGLNYRF